MLGRYVCTHPTGKITNFVSPISLDFNIPIIIYPNQSNTNFVNPLLLQIQLLRLCSSDLDLRVIEQCCLFFLLLRRIRLYNLSSTADFASLDGNLLKQRVFSSQRSWKTNLATLGSQARVSYQNKWWTPGHSNPSRGGCSLGTPFLAFPRRNSEMELDER